MGMNIKQLLDKFDLDIKLPNHILELYFDENYTEFFIKYNPDTKEEYYEFISDDKKYIISLSLPGKDGSLSHCILNNGKRDPGEGYQYNDELAIAIELN